MIELITATAVCLLTNVLDASLATRFGEHRLLEGALERGRVVIYANPSTHSFSVVRDNGDGTSCLIYSGVDLTPVYQPPRRRDG